MTQVISNKKPPYLLMMVATVLYLGVTTFFEEGITSLDSIYSALMTTTEFYLTFALCAILFLLVLFIAKRHFGIGINWPFFLLCLVLFLTDVIGVCLFPELTVLCGVYHMTTTLRLRYIAFWLAACMAFYVFFAIMPKTVKSSNDWNVVYWGGIIVALSSCLYSYVKEWFIYSSILNPAQALDPYYSPRSFTNNRNTYASLLLIGIFASFYLFTRTRKWWYFAIGVFLGVNVILTLSKTAIMCAIVFLFIFVIYDCVKTVKTNPFLSSLILILVAFFFIFPFLVRPLGLAEKYDVLAKIDSYVRNITDLHDIHGFSSLMDRSNIWSTILTFSFSDLTKTLFGIGDWNFSWYLGFLMGGNGAYIESAHSGFFDVLGRLGLIGVAFYLVLLGYFVCGIVDNYKHKRNGSTVLVAIWVCSLIHGLFEDTNFLNMQTKPMILLFMAYMPMLTNWYFDEHPEKEDKWIVSPASLRI
jgi:hypothetical protein